MENLVVEYVHFVFHTAERKKKVEVRTFAKTDAVGLWLYVYVNNLLIFDMPWIGDMNRFTAVNIAQLALCYPAQYKDRDIPFAGRINQEGFEIGDKAPYRNTHSKVCLCVIDAFELVDSGKTWFTGKDTMTGASVFYPVHLSKELHDFMK